MNAPWFKQKPDLLNELRKLIKEYFPSLNINVENDSVYIRGCLYIFTPNSNIELDHYQIEIEILNNYLDSVPIVREIGNRLPKIADRHFSKDGKACLFLNEEKFKYFPKGISIIDFIKGPVSNFFISQSYYDLTGQWIFGQRGHGITGIIEFYSEQLGTKDKETIQKFLELSVKKEIKGHWQCYCGSGIQLRKCHYEKIRDLRNKVARKDAKTSLQYFKTMKQS
jgi:hypothetical protein